MSLRTSTIAVGASIATVLAVEAAIRLRRTRRLHAAARVLRTRRLNSNSQPASVLDDLARQGLTIVELLAECRREQPTSSVPTSTLATAAQRSAALAADLGGYESRAVEPRATEAVADMRQVALRLGAALDAECTRRALGSSDGDRETPQLARRVAELDLVARELSSRSVTDH